MKRRDILKSSALFLGYAVTGGAAVAVLNGCKTDTSDGWTPKIMTDDQMAMLAEVVETILPKTDTAGAKELMIHRYIDEAAKNNFTVEEQKKFVDALAFVDEAAKNVGGKTFAGLDQVGRDKAMQALASDYKSGDIDEHIFKVLRDLTVTGYFTSEYGATEVLVYEPVPGPYVGCLPVKEIGGTYAL